MKNLKKIIAMVAVGLICSAITSEASISVGLSANGLTSLTAIVGATAIAPFTSSSGLDGSLTSTVYSGGNGSTQGGYTFVYALSQLLAASDAVDGLSLGGFAGTTFTVAYIATGTVSAAGSIYSVNPTSGAITITLGNYLKPGNTLDDIVVYDSASSYAGNSAGVLDNVGVATADLAPIPEPTTVMAGALMLLPFGIGAIRSLRKDRTA